MNTKFGLIIAAILFVVAAMILVSQMVHGLRFTGLIIGFAPLIPFFIAFFIMGRRYWIGLSIGILTLTRLALPLPVFQGLPPAVLILSLVSVLVLGGVIIEKTRGGNVSDAGFRCMMGVGAIVLIRFLYDRPGSMYFGERAGGSAAVVYVLAFFAFWAISRLAAEPWAVKKNLVLGVVLSLVTIAYDLYTIRRGGFIRTTFYIFGQPVFFVSAFLVAWLYEREALGKTKRAMPRWIGMGIVFLVSLMSAFRARIMYALAMFFVVSSVYGRTKKLLAIAAVAYIALWGVEFMGREYIPVRFARPLSLLIPVEQSVVRRSARQWRHSSETGWASPFRAQLYRAAWHQIRTRPLHGRGLGFDLREAVNLYMTARGAEGQIATIAAYGSMHNGLLGLAVMCGVPAAMLFILGYAGIVRRFAFYMRRDPESRLVTATLLGYLVMMTSQFLVNGSHFETLAVAVILGLMNGYGYQMRRRVDRVEAPAMAPDSSYLLEPAPPSSPLPPKPEPSLT